MPWVGDWRRRGRAGEAAGDGEVVERASVGAVQGPIKWLRTRPQGSTRRLTKVPTFTAFKCSKNPPNFSVQTEKQAINVTSVQCRAG